VKQQSIDAYHNLNRHHVGSQIGRILEAIRESEIPLCDRRIAVQTHLPISVIESRVCQLQKENLIKQDGTRYDPVTQNFSRVWIEAKPMDCVEIEGEKKK